jgi:hypothetical protein
MPTYGIAGKVFPHAVSRAITVGQGSDPVRCPPRCVVSYELREIPEPPL